VQMILVEDKSIADLVHQDKHVIMANALLH